MQVFLTGATGFIGQALVRTMRQRGWDIKALVRDTQSAPSRWLSAQGVNLVAGDVTQRAGLAQAMAGCHVLLHNAGVYEFGADRAMIDRMQAVNVQGTEHVLGAALEAGVARTFYVSTVWALGASGYPPEPSVPKDESQEHCGIYRAPYERSKFLAHQVALDYRAKGLPLVTLMPNGVVGVNDHSVFGYFLRLYLLGMMPPMAWGRDAMFALVDVDALAEGFCLAIEKSRMGEDYLFGGECMSLESLFAHFGRYPGGMKRRLWLPRWFMRPQMALLEPLLRAVGLPAFLSRDTVDATQAHLDYSSAKAQRDLGWTHPAPDAMWLRIITRERELMAKRSGFLNRLRHQPVVTD